MIRPVDPTSADAALLNEMRDAILRLENPMQPVRLWSATTASMPPAANWTNCALLNTTLNILAVSDGTNWIRQDTGAAI
jgi:hypothetical protein